MANAIARINRLENLGNGQFSMVMSVMFSGADIGVIMDGEVVIPLNGDESATVLRSLISTAISAWPGKNGQTWTIAGTNMTIPAFTKG